MIDISDAADLTETAREALLRDVLPALPAERRYVALMVANAMGIAARERRLGSAAVSAEAARLRALLADVGCLPPATENGSGSTHLSALRSALRSAIRAGAFDAGETGRALAAALARTARDWVAISNPKALQAGGPGASAPPGETGSSRQRWN